MSIDIEQCNFQYPGTGVGVFDVSINAAQGELIAVIGASGSGKTTMLKLVAGFEQPGSGCIRINGHDITHVPARERNMGVVFQSYALFPLMSCLDNVAYPLKIRGVSQGERHKRALAMLERVGLGAFARRFPGSMSGGQQQRVALARALVFNPVVLLLDEPLSALDAGLRVEMRSQICELQREHGITALHVTHDQEEALSMATKIALMHQGRIVQLATPQELYDNPNSRLVAAFVGQANLWEGTVTSQSRVDVGFATLACETGAYKEGEAVTVLVRPEHVQAMQEPASASPAVCPNTFRGPLASDTFLGALRRFELAPEGASARILGETTARTPVECIHIAPHHVRLLPPGDAPLA